MAKTILIIGGNALGASCATRLRRLNSLDKIIILEKDQFISFSNCGLPYFIGDEIKTKDSLLAYTANELSEKYNIDVRIKNEVIDINSNDKTIKVIDHLNNKKYTLEYDSLVLAMGANPIALKIAGLEEASNVFTLRNIEDSLKIKEYIKDHQVKKVAIIGAGFIGVELSENFSKIGCQVTMLDLAKQVLNPLDEDMAYYVEKQLRQQNIDIKLETSLVKAIEGSNKLLLSDDSILETDLIIFAIGVTPATKLAQLAQVEITSLNAVKVNNHNQTSIDNIYAGGDLVELQNYISKLPTKTALAGPANRQARLIADHINGIKSPYQGSIASAIAKVFDYTIASTGLSEKAAIKAGYDCKSIHIHKNNNAQYINESSKIVLKLVFDLNTRKVLGAQAYGKHGVDKRIDVIATSLKFKATVDDLAALELAYAPHYSTAKDIINIAGYVASNVINEIYIPFYFEDVNELINEQVQMIDLRDKTDYKMEHIKGAINIPSLELINSLDKIDFKRDVYLYCYGGSNGYLAALLLKENSFNNRIFNLSAGYESIIDRRVYNE